MANTFSKRTTGGGTLPAAGTYKFIVSMRPPITIDDSTNLNHVAADASEAADLRTFIYPNGLGPLKET